MHHKSVRTVLVGAVAAALLVAVGGVVLLGRGEASPSVRLGAGSAWFASLRTGSVALLDGSTGDRVTGVDRAAEPNANVVVEQLGASAILVDRDHGTIRKIDGASWTAGPPLTVGPAPDPQLAVHVGGDKAWVVSQAGTIVQQLDPASLTMVGAPQALPNAVSDVKVDDEGRLWVIAKSGELRSYERGEQVSEAPAVTPGRAALALAGDRPVVVDLTNGQAALINPSKGTPDRPVCLNVPLDPTPNIGGSGEGASWLLGVAPATGALYVSDLDNGDCKVVPLGATSATPRYGSPVEKNRLVFVPDFVDGKVIVVDPAKPAGQQIKARVELGLANTEIALLVHDGHVWFDAVKGDQAGVITDDLQARAVSKSEAGPASGQTPQASPATSDQPKDTTPDQPDTPNAPSSASPQGSAGSASGSAGGGAATAGAGGAPGPSTGATSGAGPTEAGIAPPGPQLPAPADNGSRGGEPAGGAGGGGGGEKPDEPKPPKTGDNGSFKLPPGKVTAQFTISANPALTGQAVTLTDATTGVHKVTGWSIPDGSPKASTAVNVGVTFANPGSFDITLTVDTDNGAMSVTRKITVNAVPTVPDIQGMTPTDAAAALSAVGLTLGNRTGSANSILPGGLVVDTAPVAGTKVTAGTAVDYRDSAGVGVISTVAGPSPNPAALDRPARLSSDGNGNIYIADWGSNQVKKLDPSGTITVIAGLGGNAGSGGDGGPATAAQLNGPIATALDAAGNIYIADELNYRVRKVDAATGTITTVAGNGSSGGAAGGTDPKATPIWPTDLDVTPDGTLWISARWQAQILKVSAAGQLSVLPVPTVGPKLTDPASIEFASDGTMYVAEPHANHILRYDGSQYTVVVGVTNKPGYNGDGMPGQQTQLHDPDAIRFDGVGNLYFPDWGNNRIRRWSTLTDKVETVAGGGNTGAPTYGDGALATDAKLAIDNPCCSSGLVFDSNGSLLFSDLNNNRVRKVAVTPPA